MHVLFYITFVRGKMYLLMMNKLKFKWSSQKEMKIKMSLTQFFHALHNKIFYEEITLKYAKII